MIQRLRWGRAAVKQQKAAVGRGGCGVAEGCCEAGRPRSGRRLLWGWAAAKRPKAAVGLDGREAAGGCCGARRLHQWDHGGEEGQHNRKVGVDGCKEEEGYPQGVRDRWEGGGYGWGTVGDMWCWGAEEESNGM